MEQQEQVKSKRKISRLGGIFILIFFFNSTSYISIFIIPHILIFWIYEYKFFDYP